MLYHSLLFFFLLLKKQNLLTTNGNLFFYPFNVESAKTQAQWLGLVVTLSGAHLCLIVGLYGHLIQWAARVSGHSGLH